MPAPPQPTLYYDLGSPYAYLAVERAGEVLGVEPRLQPVLLGGIFVMRGHGSWSQTEEREGRIAEVDERARRYALAPLEWPRNWPNNTLKAMRAVLWAERHDAGERFARVAFRRAFAAGEDLSQLAVLADVAESLGLPAAELATAVEQPEIKEELKAVTACAWERGVAGIPCIEVSGQVLYGDDQLEAAARLLADPAG